MKRRVAILAVFAVLLGLVRIQPVPRENPGWREVGALRETYVSFVDLAWKQTLSSHIVDGKYRTDLVADIKLAKMQVQWLEVLGSHGCEEKAKRGDDGGYFGEIDHRWSLLPRVYWNQGIWWPFPQAAAHPTIDHEWVADSVPKSTRDAGVHLSVKLADVKNATMGPAAEVDREPVRRDGEKPPK